MWINGRWTFCQRLLRANTKPLKLALHVLEISSCGGTPLAPYHLSTSPPPITSRRGYILLCFSKTSSHPPPSFYCTGTPRVTFARLFTVNLLAPGFLPVKGRLERTVTPVAELFCARDRARKLGCYGKDDPQNLLRDIVVFESNMGTISAPGEPYQHPEPSRGSYPFPEAPLFSQGKRHARALKPDRNSSTKGNKKIKVNLQGISSCATPNASHIVVDNHPRQILPTNHPRPSCTGSITRKH